MSNRKRREKRATASKRLMELQRKYGLEPTGELDEKTKRVLKRDHPEALKKAKVRKPPRAWEVPTGGFETNRRKH